MGKKKIKKKVGWTEFQECSVPPGIDSGTTVWLNSRYQVFKRELASGVTYLSMKRTNKEAIHDWRELLRIKNELTHPDREGIELYPGMFRVTDTSNQYHMFVLPADHAINLGWFQEGPEVSDEVPDRHDPGKGRQRALPGWMTPWEKTSVPPGTFAPFRDGCDGRGRLELVLVRDTPKEVA
tara:strand:- start:427 stop:969 length:543 start_codon:yes stop_codon:yes gene_type:complete